MNERERERERNITCSLILETVINSSHHMYIVNVYEDRNKYSLTYNETNITIV
jgi:mRNA deadenylase 3'-5' endonuclease subunit Ccr4